jgi:hypothetical protein
VQGKPAAKESFPQDLVNITDGGCYMKDEIFNVDEMSFFWKKPSRTFTAKEQKTMPGFKPAKDRTTLLVPYS